MGGKELLVAKKHTENERNKEARKILERIIKVIRSNWHLVVKHLEGDALLYLGHGLKCDGELALAIKVYNEARDLFFRDNDFRMMETVDSRIDSIKGRSGPEAVQIKRKVREDLIKSKGKEHHETILASIMLGKALAETGWILEAQRLFAETVDIAKRVLGPQNPIIPTYEANLALAKIRKAHLISDNTALNGTKVEILKLTKDGSKYIILIDGVEKKKVKVPPSKLWLSGNTPVTFCPGMLNDEKRDGTAKSTATYFPGMPGLAGRIKGYDPTMCRHVVELVGGASIPVSSDALRVVFE